MSHEPTSGQPSTEQLFGPTQPRWRIWLVRVVVFSITFATLLAVFSALGTIVEKFFIVLYSD